MRRRRRRRRDEEEEGEPRRRRLHLTEKKKYHFPAKISFSGTSSQLHFPAKKNILFRHKLNFISLRRSLIYNFVFLSMYHQKVYIDIPYKPSKSMYIYTSVYIFIHISRNS